MKTHLLRGNPLNNHLTICGIDTRVRNVHALTRYSKSIDCKRCNGVAAFEQQLRNGRNN